MSAKVTRDDLVDGVIIETVEGYRTMIDGMVGPYIRVIDADGRVPLPDPGWLAILPAVLVDRVNAGKAVVVGGEPTFPAVTAERDAYRSLHEAQQRLLEDLVPGSDPAAGFVMGQWSTTALPDQDAEGSHAVADCSCGDWEDGEIDDRCASLYGWRPAILRRVQCRDCR